MPEAPLLAKLHRNLINGIDSFRNAALTKEFPGVPTLPPKLEEMRANVMHHGDRMLQDAAIELCMGQLPRSLSTAVAQLQEMGMEFI